MKFFLILTLILTLYSCEQYGEAEAKKDLVLEFEELCRGEGLKISQFTLLGYSKWNNDEKWAINAVWEYKKDPSTNMIIYASKDGWIEVAAENFPP